MYKLEIKYIDYDENLSPRERRTLEHDIAYDLLFNMLEKHFGITSPVILKAENGKPYISNEGVYFSISHTEGLAVCVVADCLVGVDCEKLVSKSDTEIEKFAKRFFVENEYNLIKSGGFSSVDFFKVWTGKEATIKKRGSNMSDLKNIDITSEKILVFIENGYIISINV